MKNIYKIVSVLAFTLIVMVGCDNDDQILNNDSFANFNFEQDFLTVNFSSITSENATSYEWDFGDGQISTDANPEITYENFGSYTVSLSINDGDANVQRTVTVVPPAENASSFREIASLTIGGEGAAEIAAYDALNEQLFVVNNDISSAIDVIDFSNPNAPALVPASRIDVSGFGDGVNSVAVNGRYLAAAIEANTPTDNGLVVVWKADSLDGPIAQVTVGALPDMVTFTPNGDYILVANEGEPDIVDPEGSVTLIETESFTPITIGFSGFNNMVDSLAKDAFRVFGPGATLAQDVEPEYITVSPDGTTAYVSLQENNGLAIIDLSSKRVTGLVPLGLKDFSLAGNEIDATNNGTVEFVSVPVFGMYQPDAIAAYSTGGSTYVVSANEGDSRGFEESTVSGVVLDPTEFPDAATLQLPANIGELEITTENGDTNNDGIYDALWSFGARSFSIWNGSTGKLVWDSGNDLEVRANAAGFYPDDRSDNKGAEPEGVVVGDVAGDKIAFIGLERADAVAIYDVSDPEEPEFLSILEAGDAPEGLVFINAAQSPTRRSILVVSSEGDGTVTVYETAN